LIGHSGDRFQEKAMKQDSANVDCKTEAPLFDSCLTTGNGEAGETKLLLQAFEMFTQASSSLESAFSQLQAKAQRLTEELEAKNLELEKSLREKQEVQNYLRTILERLPCGVFVLDEKGGLTLCNPMASEVLKPSRRQTSTIRKSRQPFLSAEIRNYLSASASEGRDKAEVEIPFGIGNKK
jgi:PAS domain-containing protein